MNSRTASARCCAACSASAGSRSRSTATSSRCWQDGCSITLEPGGQFELSGAPLRSIHETCAEVGRHLQQVKQVGSELGVGLLGMGMNPKWPRADTPWMPKGRYKIMRKQMERKGKLGLDMMTRTCTVQANLDFASEADMVKKLRVSLALQPIATALVRGFALHRRQAQRLHELPQPCLDRHRSGPLRHPALRVRERHGVRALCRLHARCADVFRLSRRRIHRCRRPILPRLHEGQAAGPAGRDPDHGRLVRPCDHRFPGSAPEALHRDARRRRRAVGPAVRAAGLVGRAAL